MSALKLITEWSAWEYDKDKMLKEFKDNGGRYIMRGILQKSNTLNQNGRVYPQDILEREVRNYQKFIAENREDLEADVIVAAATSASEAHCAFTASNSLSSWLYASCHVVSHDPSS